LSTTASALQAPVKEWPPASESNQRHNQRSRKHFEPVWLSQLISEDLSRQFAANYHTVNDSVRIKPATSNEW